VKELTSLLARSETSASELIELVQILKLKLELEGSSCESPGEWDQEASAEAARSSRLDLLSNELHRSRVTSVHFNMVSLLRKSMTADSMPVGLLCPSSAVAATMSQRSLKPIEITVSSRVREPVRL